MSRKSNHLIIITGADPEIIYSGWVVIFGQRPGHIGWGDVHSFSSTQCETISNDQ